jgi:hypothetical protein
MGEAYRRREEIAALQAKGPKERKRLKRTLGQVKVEQVSHFNNEAAATGRGGPKATHQVDVKVMTPVEIEPTAKPQPAKPITLVTGRKLEPEDFLIHALAMADITKGSGFRQPSAKPKSFKSTSLMEQISIRMGISKERKAPERSERGQKKLASRIESNARIVLDRMIDQYPDRAAKAKKEERWVNWFVGAVIERIDGTPDLETLTAIANERINEGPRAAKYLHANGRDKHEIRMAA